jgi:hypothetical protein
LAVSFFGIVFAIQGALDTQSATEREQMSFGKVEVPMLSAKQRRTLAAIFADPVRSDVRWGDIEALLGASGAEITEGLGSRIRIRLNNRRAIFHRPHPDPVTDKGAVKSVRRFLREAGVSP